VARTSRRRVFPELFFTVLIGLSIWARCRQPEAASSASLVELPIPAARLLAGTTSLSPGQWVTLKAFSPEDKDFVPQCYVGVEIRELELQDTGMVLAAIPAKEVAALEAALADEKVRLTYHLAEQLADGSLAPSASTCESAAPASAPPAPPQVTLELPSADLQPRADTLRKDSRLRLVAAMTRPTQAEPSAKPDPDASVATACVKISGFVDARGTVQPDYDAQGTKTVQLQLPSKDITRIAAMLALPSRLWLLPDDACSKDTP
jgi:hypothetical protein